MTLKPEDTAARLAEIERRLRTLETATPAANTTITDADGKPVVRMTRDGFDVIGPAGNVVARLNRDGVTLWDDSSRAIARIGKSGLTMWDAAGMQRTRVGHIAGSSYGVQVLDPASVEQLRVDENGFSQPYLAHPWVDVADFRAVTAAGWTTTHQAQVELITHRGLFAWVTVGVDAGTTGEIRLRNAGSGATTAAVAAPAGVFTTQQFRWLHGNTLTGPIVFEVQARRTAGTGSINVYRPRSLTMASPGLCSASGV